MSNRNDGDWALFVVILGGGFVLFCVWWFSTTFGLDMSTGALKFFDDYYDTFRFGNVWPVLLGLVWCAWWPALDYWAAHAGYRLSLYDEDVTVWWNAWYTEFGVLVALIGGGFLAKKLVSDY